MNEHDIKLALDALAAEAVPATLDLWPAVRAQVNGTPAAPRLRVLRLALAGLLVALAVVGLASAPQARARLLEFLRIGNIQITLPDAQATPEALPQPPPVNLAGFTTLDEVRANTGLVVPLPAYPPDLGLPDGVYLQDESGPFVIVVWLDGDAPGQVAMALHVLGPGAFAQKSAPQTIEEVWLNGQPALWATGPHMLTVQSGSFELTQLVEGHVLVWTLGDLTLRLETDLPLEEARLVAGSVTLDSGE